MDGSLDDPNAISEQLGITPTHTQVRRPATLSKDNKPRRARPAAWFLETEDQVQSKDVRRHIDWLLNQLDGKSEAVQQLQAAGCEMTISCFWVSALGHGGPMLSPEMMKRLADFGLGIDFDIYFDDETTQVSEADSSHSDKAA